ncbi:hypothetical protein ACWGLG_16105 [Streptomyces antimycoticus]
MARIRTIKPEFFTSLTVADLTPEQRLTFIGLWTHADDAGRCVDDPRLIKAAIWPLDDRTAADIEIDLKALTESSLITRYIVNRKRYLAVTNWDEHQRINRPTPTKLPAPEEGERPDPEPPTSNDVDSMSPHTQLHESSRQERKGKEGNREGKGSYASVVDEAEAVVLDVDCVESAEADQQQPITAQTIVAEYLEHVAKRPPKSVIGQVAKHAKQMLEESIDPDDIRRGLALWMSKGLHPNTIPSVVNEAMNARPAAASNVFALASGQPLPGPDTTLAGWAAVAASFDSSEDSA